MYPWMNVTKSDRHFFVWENVIVRWLNSLLYSIAQMLALPGDSVTTTFFEVFRLFKFVNKIRCTENYLELHKTNDIYENPINQGLIWNLFWMKIAIAKNFSRCYIIVRNFAWHALKLCKVKVLGFFYKIFLDLHNFVKIIILKTCLMII